MLDKNIVVEEKEKVEYPPIPKDIYQAELLDIEAKERATYETRNNPEEAQDFEMTFNFQFTILKGQDGEKDLRCRNVWANFIPSYLYTGKNGKNKLWRIIEALYGRELTKEDTEKNISGDFLNRLIGKQCRISVEPKVKGDKTWDNITDWLKVKEELDPLTEEEKDKCKVKNKKEEKEIDGQEINTDDIPF